MKIETSVDSYLYLSQHEVLNDSSSEERYPQEIKSNKIRRGKRERIKGVPLFQDI